ncbi:RHS repeat protein [Salmonella enterica subsp. enterica]|nr:RHS repeat protein [Salmonella enterica subsp. enterica]
MSGKPAARMGDMTKYGGPIVQGSAGVLIGAPTGVACSVCPNSPVEEVKGHPVNPLLGAKVLPGETDFALPGPLAFILSRAYSSYRTKTPAPSGLFGPGWKMAADMRLQICERALILNDNGGRSIHFEPLSPGESSYSRSESFWLARCGVLMPDKSNPLHDLWQALPEEIRLSPNTYLATNSIQGPWWVLGWPERVPGADEALPAPLPPYRVLTGLADSYGRTLTYHRAAEGEFTGNVTGVTDGAGRRFQLVLTTQAQRAEAAQAAYATAGTSRSAFTDFPETLPATEYGADNGIRLSQVWLTHEPDAEGDLEPVMLSRYEYTPCGELAAVYDRGGMEVRRFLYDAEHPGRMTGHRYAGRPQMRYRYDETGRVTEQLNPEGLSYRYAYEKNQVAVTDSLGRREVLHLKGEGGLKRVVMKASSDGSVTRSEYDPAGRLKAQTDAAGRRSEYSLHMASGMVTAVTGPDGRTVRYGYNSQRQLTSTTYPDGLRSTREYDERGRLTAETSRTGETTRYSYDNPQSELPTGIQDATGSNKAMCWNRYGQMVAFTDCSGYETRYEYDRFGQMTAVHREEGQSIYRSYNHRGQLTAVRDSQGRETRYDYNDAGDVTTVTGPDGSRTETQYDGWGKALSTTQGGLTPEQMAGQLEPEYTPQRKIHLYHCDQRGLPLALITPDNTVAWRGEYDEWGNLSGEENPADLEQLIRLPGQQYDEESGLYYNRHRYYNPGQGRYITQDPIGLKGGWNLYQYPLNPVTGTDPLGLKVTFKGDEEQQKAMKEAYESVRKTKHGQEMIEKMELSDHDYIFRGPRKGMEYTCYDPSEYTFYIEIDFDHAACQYQGKGKACKLTPTPLSVVIAHEMGHAMGENDDGPGHMNNVKKHENPVRKEMGIPPRMKY